jgi:hypothetical protein
MAKDDQQEAFEKVLSSTLSRIIDFLKFAEAKNAALLTFASAWIIGSVNFLTRSSALSADWRAAFTVALPFFAGAAQIAILSFLPKMHLSNFHQDPMQAKALLYFADAATFSTSAYKERFRERYYPPEGETSTRNYLDDLAIQVAVNSQITTRKLKFFNVGACAVLVALAVLATPALLAAWRAVAALIGKQ